MQIIKNIPYNIGSKIECIDFIMQQLFPSMFENIKQSFQMLDELGIENVEHSLKIQLEEFEKLTDDLFRKYKLMIVPFINSKGENNSSSHPNFFWLSQCHSELKRQIESTKSCAIIYFIEHQIDFENHQKLISKIFELECLLISIVWLIHEKVLSENIFH